VVAACEPEIIEGRLELLISDFGCLSQFIKGFLQSQHLAGIADGKPWRLVHVHHLGQVSVQEGRFDIHVVNLLVFVCFHIKYLPH
jgi:hypothetical protein